MKNEIPSKQQNKFNQFLKDLSQDDPEINNYYVINMETNIASSTKNILGFEHKFGVLNDPYILILEVYPSLLDWTKYFESLKYFMSLYDRVQITNVYNSLSQSKIFFENSHFNWLLSCLFYANDKKQFLRNYGQLKTLGFKVSEILKLIKTQNNLFDISQDLLNSCYDVKDPSVKKILYQISKSKDITIRKENEARQSKFYDKTKTHNKFNY